MAMIILMNKQTSIINFPKRHQSVNINMFFDRLELQKIMNIYGKMVSAGIWRDYEFQEGKGRIGFAVFQRTTDKADYLILKEPRMATTQGGYSIIGREGHIIKRGQNLDTLLKFFNTKLLKLIP